MGRREQILNLPAVPPFTSFTETTYYARGILLIITLFQNSRASKDIETRFRVKSCTHLCMDLSPCKAQRWWPNKIKVTEKRLRNVGFKQTNCFRGYLGMRIVKHKHHRMTHVLVFLSKYFDAICVLFLYTFKQFEIYNASFLVH